MKENYTQLYPNQQVSRAVGDYSYEHGTKLPKHITDHHAWGTETQDHPDYMISPFQAQGLWWMAKAVGAKKVLEIGTFIGFSTMAWSHAVGPSGHVTALEFNPAFAQTAEKAFAENDIKNCTVIVGDAKDSLKDLAKSITEPFDLIFIDADKVSYPAYLSLILGNSIPSSGGKRLLRQGGIILADNVLRRGLIADSSDANPWTARLKSQGEKAWRQGDMEALDKFNTEMAANERLETFLMPMFDGLGCGRLVD